MKMYHAVQKLFMGGTQSGDLINLLSFFAKHAKMIGRSEVRETLFRLKKIDFLVKGPQDMPARPSAQGSMKVKKLG
jgi:hypothetical protein